MKTALALSIFLCACTPDLKKLKTEYPHVIYHGTNQPFTIEINKSKPSHWVNLSEISKKAQEAIVVSEDWSFYQHPGYDANQIQEVMKDSVEEGRIKRGASTITQQVARNVFLTQERSLIRKIRELWIATKLEKVLGKKRILEIYLNIAEFGDGIFGIEEASQTYFAKPASALTAKEGAFLAMLLPSPKKYSMSFRRKQLTHYASRTTKTILQKMETAHFLTPEEFEAESAVPFKFEASSKQQINDTLKDEETSE